MSCGVIVGSIIGLTILFVNRQTDSKYRHTHIMKTISRSAFGKRLYDSRREAKLTQKDVAKKIGIAQGTLSELESDGNGSSYTSQLADIYKVSAVWLETGKGEKNIIAHNKIYFAHAVEHSMLDDIKAHIPTEKKLVAYTATPTIERYFPRVVGTARMGDQGYYLDLDGGNGYLEFEAEPGSIAIQVRGESMHPAIRDGWYVVIEPSGRPTTGEYVLLGFNDGRKMVKELLMEKPDCYVVMSVNSGERITAMKEELTNIQAITAVVPPSKHKP